VEVAEIFAIQGSENEITVLFVVRDETQGSEKGGKLLDRDYSVRRVSTDHSLRAGGANHGGMRLRFHLVDNLSVSEEKHHAVFYHVLENKIFVVVALNHNVRENYIVNSCLPLVVLVLQGSIVINFLLRNVRIEYLFVNSAPESRWHSSFGILD